MSKEILLKPIISEKSELLSESRGQYTFMVVKTANKIEIKKAVEEMYGVNVDSVNTLIMPSKTRTRGTKRGFIRGSLSSFKKAVVTLSEGEEIDLYGEI